MSKSSSDRLLKMMKEGGRARDQAILELWDQLENTFNQIARGIGLSEAGTEDAKQLATIKLYKAIEKNKMKGDTDAYLVNYFKGIFTNTCLDESGNERKGPTEEYKEYLSPTGISIDPESLKDLEIELSNFRKMEECFQALDEICKKMIDWRYFRRPPISWNEIAIRLGYKDHQVAQTRGERCKARLRRCMVA